MKKIILFTLVAMSLSSAAYASGYARIKCQSEHAGISLYHFGFPQTVGGVRLTVEGVVNDADSVPTIDGKNLYVDDGYRFSLKNLFSSEGASYPLPDFELQVKVFGEQYVTFEKGKCVFY